MNAATYWTLFLSLTVVPINSWGECARNDFFASPRGDPIAYRQRETRCEGTHPKGVSARLDFIGYHSGRLSFESQDAPKLPSESARIAILGLGSELDRPVLLHAQSFKQGIYYQMDTDQFDKLGGYIWPLDVIRLANLRADELALVACSNKCLARSPETKYWPVAVNGNRTKEYTFVILSSANLGTLEMSIWKDGKLIRPYVAQKRFHPADVPVNLPLSTLPSGLYTADIVARIYGTNEQIKETIHFIFP